jgi:DNA-binding CsgD family transcriptional regulator
MLERSVSLGSSPLSRSWLSAAMVLQGDLEDAARLGSWVAGVARVVGSPVVEMFGMISTALASAMGGRPIEARAAAERILEVTRDMGIYSEELQGHVCLALAALADGDAQTAKRRLAESTGMLGGLGMISVQLHHAVAAEAEAALGDLAAARVAAERSIAKAREANVNYGLAWGLTVLARVALEEGALEDAEAAAYEALAVATRVPAKVGIADLLEVIGALRARRGDAAAAGRMFGAAEALRQQTGAVRFKTYESWFHSAVDTIRAAIGEAALERTWAEGRAMSMEEAVAYASRGRGARRRPASGWASLTPAELDVVRVVADGLANKEIAAQLFISPRTVQAHLTHAYAKLGVTSRVQLAQQAVAHRGTPHSSRR